jgi:hypothetical protein
VVLQAPKNVACSPRNGAPASQKAEQTLQFSPYYCTYVLKFSALVRDGASVALFLKIVFDKGGVPAY